MQENHKKEILREKLIYRYVQALDQGDLDQVADILEQSMNDPELDRAITEINLAIEVEEGLSSLAVDAEKVGNIARKHLHAPAEADTIEDKPLTVGEVAARLKSDRRVPFVDIEANERLLTISHPLPAWLSIQAVKQLAGELGVTASDRFWLAFHDTAVMLSMGRSHQTQLLAARPESSRRTTRENRGLPFQQSTDENEKE